MNRDMARVLGGLSVVLLLAGLAAYDAGAQDSPVGKWKELGVGGTLDIAKDPSDATKFIGTLKREGQADQTIKDLKIKLDPFDPEKAEGCLNPPCNQVTNPVSPLKREKNN